MKGPSISYETESSQEPTTITKTVTESSDNRFNTVFVTVTVTEPTATPDAAEDLNPSNSGVHASQENRYTFIKGI